MAAPTTYPVDTIARLLDLTPRRVQQLSAEGVIPKADRGRYDLVGAVRGYIRHMRDRLDNGTGTEALNTHRVRLTKSKADMAELEQRQMIGELIPADDVEAAWSTVTSAMRARLLGIPPKAAPRVIQFRNAVEAQSYLRAQINEALEELASCEVRVSAPLRASDTGADGEVGSAAGEAAADADDLRVG